MVVHDRICELDDCLLVPFDVCNVYLPNGVVCSVLVPDHAVAWIVEVLEVLLGNAVQNNV